MSAGYVHYGSGLGFRVWLQGFDQMSNPHAHPDIEVNFLTHGSLKYFHAGKFYKLEPYQMAIFWAGLPHQVIECKSSTWGIIITLPLAWFLQWNLVSRFRNSLMSGALVREQDNPSDRLLLASWLETFKDESALGKKIILLELEARLHRLSGLKNSSWKKDPLGSSGNSQIERITQYITQHFCEDLSVEKIAAAVRLHPKYLMHVFKKQCSMSLWEYVLRLRISHAQRLLLTSDLKVLDIALEAGFGSLGSFYPAFRKYVSGIHPLQYRRQFAPQN